MHSLFSSFLRIIYTLPETDHTPARSTHNLQVLALGISRSGTESLRQALYQLGYSDVHHGYRFILQTDECL